MPRDATDRQHFSWRKHGYWMSYPGEYREATVNCGLAKEKDSHGKKYELNLGGKHRFIESTIAETCCRLMYGQKREAEWHLERENWLVRDPGWDLEHEVDGRIDVKAVPIKWDNPCLMVRYYTPEENHPPYPCTIFLNMWVKMDGIQPVAAGAVGWMPREAALAYPVRDEFCGTPLQKPCRCVQHWKQEPLSKLWIKDMAASPQLAMFD